MADKDEKCSSGSGILGYAFAGRLADVVSGSLFQSLTREFEYLANARGPTLLPSVEQLTRLWYTGWIPGRPNPRRDFVKMMLCYGIDISSVDRSTAGGNERRFLWNQFLVANKPRYPVSFLRKIWRDAKATAPEQADLLEVELREALQFEGFPERAQQDWYLNEDEELGTGDLTTMLRLGLLSGEDEFRRLASILGFSNTSIDRLLALRFQQMGAQDLIATAAARGADAAFALKWQLDTGKPDWWDTWARRAGLGHVIDTDFAFGSTGPTPDQEHPEGHAVTKWSDIIWRTHWRMPSVGDLSQILHRFRGDPQDSSTWNFPPSPFNPGGGPVATMIGSGTRPLTLDEANEFMDANGIPPRLRAHYYNLMYRPLGMREARVLIAVGAAGPGELSGWLQDSGLRATDANRVAAAMVAQAAVKAAAPIQRLKDQAWRKYVGAVEAAYDAGSIDRTTAENGLAANGVPPDVIQTTLDTVDITVHTGVVKSVIRRARADWFAGKTNELEARGRLGMIGIAGPRINTLVAAWKAERGHGQTVATTAKIQRWLRKGYISKDEAIRRLDNLGWSKADELLLLAEVQAEIASDSAKMLTTLEKDKKTQIRESESLLKGAVANANRIMTHIRKIRPKADLLKWYAAGRLSEAEVREALQLQGYDEEAIDLYLVTALDKSAATPKTTVNPPNTTSGN